MSDKKEIEIEPGWGCLLMFFVFMVIMVVLWGATMQELVLLLSKS